MSETLKKRFRVIQASTAMSLEEDMNQAYLEGYTMLFCTTVTGMSDYQDGLVVLENVQIQESDMQPEVGL